MNDTANFILALVLGVGLFLVFAVPLGFWLFGQYVHRKRRRLERSKRQIAVGPISEAPQPGGCPHKRSKSRAREGEDGKMRSVCRFCGAPMIRHARGDWEAVDADAASAGARNGGG